MTSTVGKIRTSTGSIRVIKIIQKNRLRSGKRNQTMANAESIETTIFPTVEVIANLKMLDSYAGLTLPLMASATATFLFRQFFMTLPDELIEAARIDGASPMRFFRDIVLPLSKTNLAALFVITFIYGWNQYLWPLLIIQDVNLGTAVAGIKGMIATGEGTTLWNQVMAAMLLTLIPPVVIVLAMQRAFVRGLVDSEK